MKSIIIYLLPLFLLFSFSLSAYSQTNLSSNSSTRQPVFSKADSVLAATYFSEADYNEMHGIYPMSEGEENYSFEEDEIYNDSPAHKIPKKRKRSHFWEAVVTEVVIDVIVNTVFIMTAFWN